MPQRVETTIKQGADATDSVTPALNFKFNIYITVGYGNKLI